MADSVIVSFFTALDLVCFDTAIFALADGRSVSAVITIDFSAATGMLLFQG